MSYELTEKGKKIAAKIAIEKQLDQMLKDQNVMLISMTSSLGLSHIFKAERLTIGAYIENQKQHIAAIRRELGKLP